LGSSGPTLLPDQPGAPAHVLIQPGKDGTIYVLDRDKMGGYGNGSDAILQKFKMKGGCYTAAAAWNGRVYIACEDDHIRAYNLVKGQLLETAAVSTTHFDNPGATPAVSANGSKDGIVWAIATNTWNGPQQKAILYAFDATKMGDPIYTSEQNTSRDRAANATRFVIPLVANGRVYFGARGEVEIYGPIH
jgi:outer membrane protein assembly factor BamB